MNSRYMESAAPFVIFLLVLTACSLVAFRTPKAGTWDILAYTGCVASQRTSDATAIHRYAYDQVARHTSASNMADLTQASEFRRAIASDSLLFGTNLPYYSIRPLYVMTLSLLARFGVSPVTAASGIAALSYFGIGLVTFLWLRRHVPQWLAVTGASVLILTGPTLLLGRLYTPDGMSACAILLAMYLIVEARKLLPGLTLLIVSIFIRTDSVVFVGCVLLMLMVVRDEKIRLRPAHAFTLLVVAGLSFILINHFSGNYGYASLMHNQFVRESDFPDAPVRLSVGLYIKGLMSGMGLPNVLHGSALPFLLLGLFSLARVRSVLRDMTFAVLVAATAHFVIFPLFQDRLYAYAYILCAIAAVTTLEQPLANSLRPVLIHVSDRDREDSAVPTPVRASASKQVSSR